MTIVFADGFDHYGASGTIIDVVPLHVNQGLSGDYARVIARACYVFQTGDWRRRWREAKEADDFEAMDRLDREFERIGLP